MPKSKPAKPKRKTKPAKATDPWLAELEQDQDLLRLQTARDTGTSFVHHDPEEKRLKLDYFWHPIEKRLFGAAYFGPEAEGPPGCAHGGSIAAVMDDSMGTAAWATGHRVVALNLSVDYRTFVPLLSRLRLETWVDKVDGRKVFTKGVLKADDGAVHAEGNGLFYEIDFAKLLDKKPSGPVA